METDVIIIKLERNLYKFVFYLFQHIEENIWYKVLSTTYGDSESSVLNIFLMTLNTNPAKVTLPKGTKHLFKTKAL